MTEDEVRSAADTEIPGKDSIPETENPEPAEPQPETDAKKAEKLPLSGEGILLLVLSLASALWFCFGHTLIWQPNYHGPGIGLTLTHWGLTAAVLVTAGRKHLLRHSPEGIFLLLLSLLLSAVYGIFANLTMKILNLPVLLLMTAQALFALTGQNCASPLSGQGLWEGFRRYWIGHFLHWGVPFHALASRRRNRKNSGMLLVGIWLSVIAATLALTILSSADTVFSGIVVGALDQVTHIDGGFILRLFLSLLLGMALFSHRFSLLQTPREIRPVQRSHPEPTVFCMVLSALALVYALFAYVQVRYLFAGEESVRMAGGYAAYARSGFFQLVLVALLTLGLILPALTLCGKSRKVRVLCAIVTLLTAVIDFSAFFRVRLYIASYGLTVLRMVTLWGIGIILLALLAAFGKALRPALRICPIIAAAALTSWVVLNLANPDRIVSENLVARYNAQTAAESAPDPDHGVKSLASDNYWSPDYYAAFEKISDTTARAEALELLHERGAQTDDSGHAFRDPSVYDWSLSFLKLPEPKVPSVLSEPVPEEEAGPGRTEPALTEE